uniref:Uncharacterized protein n=1 Tax=Meloidogyne hapla TaxID=6305 RepID=A0A1I8B6K3_MELHA
MNSSLMISTLLIFIVLNKVNNTQITLNGIAALAYCQEKLILEGTSYEEKGS